MRILKSVIDTINDSISGLPPETGGILGSHDNELIDEVVMDSPVPTNTRPCSYFPNVDFLNQNIKLWQDNGISFAGIFHTHFAGVKTLSCGDRKYINAIMCAMPQQINGLYFPVFVLPDRELVCYKAIRTNGIIDIQAEELVIE